MLMKNNWGKLMMNKSFVLNGTSRVVQGGFFLIMFLTLSGCTSAPDNHSDANFKQLFNGNDLNDWIVKINHHPVDDNYGNTFRVEDGILKVRYDEYEDFNDRFGHLYYKQPYSYYHLIVEYRFVEGWHKNAPEYTIKNSGVMFHSQDPRTMNVDQDWPISVELQLLAGLGDGEERPTGNMCSPGTDVVYEGQIDPRHCINSSSKTYEGDQWVRAELIVLGDSLIKHIINGDTVLQYTKPQIGGGIVNNYDPALKQDGKLLSEGFIALQSEGQEIDFRKVAILDLADCRDPLTGSLKNCY